MKRNLSNQAKKQKTPRYESKDAIAFAATTADISSKPYSAVWITDSSATEHMTT